MPLIHGKSPASFSKNVATEMHEGKPLKQSLAIAYSMKRRAKKEEERRKMEDGGEVKKPDYYVSGDMKLSGPGVRSIEGAFKKQMAHGGRCESHGVEMCEMCHGGKMAHGGFVHEEKATGYHSLPEEHEKHNHAAIHEDDRMLNQHGEEEVGPEGIEEDSEHHYDRKVSHPVENQSDHEDMVGEIMHARRKHFSHGGRVANDTPIVAGFEPNQFDDLVKDDDDMEFHYTGANSGDEIGDHREDEDRHDMVREIMRDRRKKGRMPHPM